MSPRLLAILLSAKRYTCIMPGVQGSKVHYAYHANHATMDGGAWATMHEWLWDGYTL